MRMRMGKASRMRVRKRTQYCRFKAARLFRCYRAIQRAFHLSLLSGLFDQSGVKPEDEERLAVR